MLFFHSTCIGKLRAFQALEQSADELIPLGELGKEQGLTPETKCEAFKFVGFLYGCQDCTFLKKMYDAYTRETKSKAKETVIHDILIYSDAFANY